MTRSTTVTAVSASSLWVVTNAPLGTGIFASVPRIYRYGYQPREIGRRQWFLRIGDGRVGSEFRSGC